MHDKGIGMVKGDWVEPEIAGSLLKDKQLTLRLGKLLRQWSKCPDESIPTR